MNRSWRIFACFCMSLILCLMLCGCGVLKKVASAEVVEGISTETLLAEADTTSGYALAKQSGILEEDWKEFTFKLNSVVITLPCTATNLEGVGLKMDTSFMAEDTIVNRGNRESVYFKNEFGDAILVTFMNPDRLPKALNECLVTGIAVTEYDLTGRHLTVTFPGGVELGSEKSTALIAYGSEYELYESDAVHMYTWHDSSSYYKSCEIDYDAESLKACSMFLNF
ncbi:MAG: hypothetical protein PHQ72_08775 [Hespellia sp.]|nr:hypothetical protein [Hespellia sp.]